MSEEAKSDGILVAAAKAVGSVAGKIASLAPHGSQGQAATGNAGKQTDRKKDGKFLKSHKTRLPRKQKKALAKHKDPVPSANG